MLIPGQPLEIQVEQPDHSFITYTSVESMPEGSAKVKAQNIISSQLRVSKFIIKLG